MKKSESFKSSSEYIREINELYDAKISDSVETIKKSDSTHDPTKKSPFSANEIYTPDIFSLFDFSKNKSTPCSNKIKSRTDVGIIANVLSEKSTTGLIMNDRPNLMAPKCEKELKNHIKLNEKYFNEIKKNNEKNIQKQLSYYNNKLKKEENVSNLIFKWKNKIIPNWNTLCYSNETKSMWWEGLPPCIRSIVWKFASENNLQLTKSFINILLNESEQNINLYHNGKLIDYEDISKLNGCVSTYKAKQVIRMIELDVNRTYPHLNIFQTVYK
uniref:TBC1 domain family member 14 (Trinotate prediction) n=1 Tax=Myxobolus squamalis TaxID=59785 RepID=A0A6B2G3W9_MYXSQ